MSARIPAPHCVDEDAYTLAQIVAKYSLLPNLQVVRELQGPAFPTIRNTTRRSERIQDGDRFIGMYDDNSTPAWALFWAHGLKGTRPKGWNIIHVWEASKDLTAYTHLANLALVPECLASLTDKCGPLTSFLRWHACSVYGWKPEGRQQPLKPACYEQVNWTYLPYFGSPSTLIRERLAKLKSKRSTVLRDLMKLNPRQ